MHGFVLGREFQGGIGARNGAADGFPFDFGQFDQNGGQFDAPRSENDQKSEKP